MKRSHLFFWPLFAGSLSAALLRGGPHAFRLFYILCGVLTFSLVFTIGVKLTMRVSTVLPRSFITTGQSVRWRVVAYSSFFLPVPAVRLWYFTCHNMSGPKTNALHVRPHQQTGVDEEHTFSCRGKYKMGVSKWAAPDYTTLFFASGRTREASYVSVLPRVIEMEDTGVNRPAIETNAFDPATMPEFDGVRPYENTDTMRSIHWKLSTKTEDGWMVKKTCGFVPAPVFVLIDMTSVPCAPDVRGKREDKLLETAFSLIRQLMISGPVRVAAVTTDVRYFTISSKSDFAEFYLLIGLADFGDGEPDEQMSGLEIDSEAALWVVSSHTGEAVTKLMYERLAYDCTACWLYIPSGDVCTESERLLLNSMSDVGVLTSAVAADQDIRVAAWMLAD